MPSEKMHTDEVDTSQSLVRQLLTRQFPQWANLPLKAVLSAGTDNAIYRLGDDMSVRLPRINWAITQIDKENSWLPRLAPHLPLAIPELLAKGKPDEGYPYDWAIYRWIEGENKTIDQVSDPRQAAVDIAHFIIALQKVDPVGGPLAAERNLRGVSLKPRDEATRGAIKLLEGMIDANAALAVWKDALQAPEWQGEPVWFHGDLLIGNVLFKQDRLSAVIDFGGLGVGDPACDLMIAWSLFSGKSRDVLRNVLNVNDATWARGRGQALSQAVIFIPYYLDTNPIGVKYARRMIDEILA